jgi:GAF domain-containing protein
VSYLLLHSESWSPEGLVPVLESAHIERRAIRQARELVPNGRPSLLLLDPEGRDAFPVDALRAFVDAGGAIVALGRAGESDVPEGLPTDLLSGFLPEPVGERQLLVAIRAGYREAVARGETARALAEAATRSREIDALAQVGLALGTERDLDKLLDLILTQARHITRSDAGSLYLVETGDGSARRLRFRLAQNFSVRPAPPFVEISMPLDRTSIAGYVATTGEPLVIDDAYHLPANAEYSFNSSFDERYSYRTKSVLVIPMKDHREEIIAVLQLINCKRDPDVMITGVQDTERQVVPYSSQIIGLGTALASQAAVSIENARLYQDIERLFDQTLPSPSRRLAEVLASPQGRLAGRYTIEREIGRGGMATVYLAHDLKHGRSVAVKLLRPELAAALGAERFLREIGIAAGLQHPHVLSLMDSGSDRGLLYYVMPYVEGGSLRRRLVRERWLPVDGAFSIAADIAGALHYCHSRGVLHRDIKPENILLSASHAIVADFGIAKAVDTAGGPNLTRTGFPLGTPGYMSPEQAAGHVDLDERTDVYSLAIVIYEMLVGEIPGSWPIEDDAQPGRFFGVKASHRSRLTAVGSRIEAALVHGLALRHDRRTLTPMALVAELTGT